MRWGLKSIRRVVVVLGVAVLAVFLVNRPFAGEGEGLEADVANLERTRLSAHLKNEKGVRLRSESYISLGCGMTSGPESPHRMIFDKPFLVLLQRRDREVPYLAMWVENAELLVK
ncbi:MAG: hypothetical protein ACYC6Y_18950 [Thermoguttaceae bacterium]